MGLFDAVFDPPCSRGSKPKNRDCARTRRAIVLPFWTVAQACVFNGMAPFPRCRAHVCRFRRHGRVSPSLLSPCRVRLFYRSETLFTCIRHLFNCINAPRMVFTGLWMPVHIHLPPGPDLLLYLYHHLLALQTVLGGLPVSICQRFAAF